MTKKWQIGQLYILIVDKAGANDSTSCDKIKVFMLFEGSCYQNVRKSFSQLDSNASNEKYSLTR